MCKNILYKVRTIAIRLDITILAGGTLKRVSFVLPLCHIAQNFDNGQVFCTLYRNFFIYCIIFKDMFIILLRIILKN